MIITTLNLNDSEAKSLFPDIVCGIIHQPSSSVFAAIEDNTILAAVVVSASDSFVRYTINHIYLRECESINVLRELIDVIEDMCTDSGETALAVKLTGDFREWSDIHGFLMDYSYIPLSFDGCILKYYLADLFDSVFAQKRDQLSSMMKYVRSYNDLDKIQLEIFREALKKSSKHEQLTLPDLMFGRFYVVDNEIMGFMDAKELSPELIFVSDLYVHKHEKTKYAFPMMLASLINVLKAFMPEDSSIYIQSYSDAVYDPITAVFGEPDQNISLLEYCKKL